MSSPKGWSLWNQTTTITTTPIFLFDGWFINNYICSPSPKHKCMWLLLFTFASGTEGLSQFLSPETKNKPAYTHNWNQHYISFSWQLLQFPVAWMTKKLNTDTVKPALHIIPSFLNMKPGIMLSVKSFTSITLRLNGPTEKGHFTRTQLNHFVSCKLSQPLPEHFNFPFTHYFIQYTPHKPEVYQTPKPTIYIPNILPKSSVLYFMHCSTSVHTFIIKGLFQTVHTVSSVREYNCNSRFTVQCWNPSILVPLMWQRCSMCETG